MQATSAKGQLLAYRHKPGLVRTVVFANSLGSDQSIWDPVIEGLGGGFGTLTYDLRGHGQSAEADPGYDIASLADDLIALMERLQLSDVLLCGVSIGGMIAQCIAARRPDLLAGVILCNTAPRVGSESRWMDRISSVQQAGMQAMSETVVDNWFGASYKASNPDLLKAHASMVARVPAASYIATCVALCDADLTCNSARIAVPCICVAGSEDSSVPPAAVEAMASLIEGAEYQLLDGVGHIPSLEAPEYLVRIIETLHQRTADDLDGQRIRRAVLGDVHVSRAEAGVTSLDAPFQALITESAWGRVWASPALAARERSLLTLALLAATGNFDEIPMHIRATLRTGASESDVTEAFQHVAIYAGVPKANHALKLAKATLHAMRLETEPDSIDSGHSHENADEKRP